MFPSKNTVIFFSCIKRQYFLFFWFLIFGSTELFSQTNQTLFAWYKDNPAGTKDVSYLKGNSIASKTLNGTALNPNQGTTISTQAGLKSGLNGSQVPHFDLNATVMTGASDFKLLSGLCPNCASSVKIRSLSDAQSNSHYVYDRIKTSTPFILKKLKFNTSTSVSSSATSLYLSIINLSTGVETLLGSVVAGYLSSSTGSGITRYNDGLTFNFLMNGNTEYEIRLYVYYSNYSYDANQTYNFSYSSGSGSGKGWYIDNPLFIGDVAGLILPVQSAIQDAGTFTFDANLPGTLYLVESSSLSTDLTAAQIEALPVSNWNKYTISSAGSNQVLSIAGVNSGTYYAFLLTSDGQFLRANNTLSVIQDATPPTLTSVAITSNNTTSSKAKAGDIISVSLTANESIQTPTITIAGQAATVTGSGTSYTGTYTVTSSTTEGLASISIGYRDLANNIGTTVTSTTNSSTVTVDRTAPSAPTVVSTQASTSTPTLTGTAEANSTVNVIVNGTTYTTTASGAGAWSITTNAIPEGVYSVTATAKDATGNTSTSGSGSLTFDNTSPTLSSVNISTNNTNASKAKVGDVISLSITASESIHTPVVTIAGQSATITGTGSTYTATYTVTSSTLEGTVGFSITYSDLVGNNGNAISSTTNASSVEVDKTAPSINTVSIISSNANPVIAKIGDVISLDITSNEAIQLTNVTIAGQSATVTGTGVVYAATYIVTSSAQDGTAGINIVFRDLAGNQGVAVTSTTNNSVVTVDRTLPTLSLVSMSSNNVNSSRATQGNVLTLSLTSSESIQTPVVTIAGQSATITGTGSAYTATYTVTSSTTEGAASINISFSDIAGNAGIAVSATTNSSSVVVDRSAPLLSSLTISSNNTNTTKAKVGDVISVSITSSESIQTPVVTIAGQSATITGTGSTYTATYTVTSSTPEGTAAINVSYSDLAGNAGVQATATTNSSSVTVDRTAPTLSSVAISSNNANTTKAKVGDVVTVSLMASESIQTPTVTIASQAATVTGTGGTYTATYTVISSTPQGNATININYSDVSGNAGTAVTTTSNSSSVLIDYTAPTVPVVNALLTNNPTPTITGTAENTSLVSVAVNGSTYTTTASGSGSWSVTATTPLPAGTYTASVTATDAAGNISLAGTSNIVIDTQVPSVGTLTISSNNANTTKAKVGDVITVALTASESIQTPVVTVAGQSATITGTGSTYTATYTVTSSTLEGTAAINVSYSDLAGNAGIQATATTNSSSVVIDYTAPTGYTLAINQASITQANQGATSISLTGAEVGSSYNYTVSIGSGTVSGTGTITSTTQTISNINVSSLADGLLTYSVRITDAAGNIGTAVTQTVGKDALPPTVSSVTTSAANGSYKAGDVIPIVVNFTEPVNVTGTPQLTLITGTASSTTTVNYSSGSGTTSFTFNYTVGSNNTSSDLNYAATTSLVLNGGTIIDAGNNIATLTLPATNSSNSLAGTSNIVIDTQVPSVGTITISSNNTNTTKAKVGDVISVSITSSESIQTPVITVAGQSATITGTGSTYTATYTVTSSTPEGTAAINVSYSDLAGNAGVQATATTNSSSVTVDRTAPTLSSVAISSNNTNTTKAKVGDVVTLSLTASESIQTPTVTIASQAATVTGTGGTYTATYTVTSSTPQGTASISITFVDLSANNGSVVTTTTNNSAVLIDRTAPTITIVSNPANLRSGQSSVITFTVSESVSDFVQSDVTVSGGTLANWTAVSGVFYTAEFTPTANSNVNGVIDVGVAKFTDEAGNTNSAAGNTVTISIDNTLPTVTITSSSSALKVGETATITFTFSEAVLGFDLMDVTMTNGTFGTLTQSSPTVYTVEFTPSTNLEGTAVISIGGTKFTDLAGNDNAASASLSPLAIDTKIPSITSSSLSWGTSLNAVETATAGTITVALTNVENGRTVSVSINGQSYNGTASSNAATLTIPSADLGALTEGITYAVTTTVSDAAGNAAPAATASFMVDKTAPSLTTVAIVSNNAVTNLAKLENTITLSITSSEAIATPTVTIAGNAATATGSGTNWTATFVANATTSEGIATISINYADLAGNPGTAVAATTNSSTVKVDRTAPSMTISSSASSLKIGSTATITFTSSEATTNFIQSDVTLTGGALSAWTAVSSTVYTATITPNANTAVNGNLSVTGDKFTDAAGNANGASNNVSFIIDTFIPTVALTSNVTSLNANQTATINFTFNESVTGFTASDIVATNGTIGALTGSGSVYSVVFTPVANFNGIASISVASNTFSDTIGNSNTDGADANNSFTVSIDASAPSISSATISSSNTDSTLGNIGDVVTIDFVTSETVNSPIVTMDGQTAFVSGDGINWTATYVIINSTNDGVLAFAIDYTDLVGNVGTTRTSTTDGTSVSVLKNQPPIDNSTPITLSQNDPNLTINLLNGITDPEGDPMTVSNVVISYSVENVVTNQPVIINSTTLTKFQDVVSTADLSGTNLFIEMSKSKFLSGSQKGQINVSYVVTDGNNNLNANAVINIIGANDQPTGAAVTLNQVVINGQNMGIPLSEGVGVSTNVPGIDPDDDSVTYTLSQNANVSNGQFVFNPDGSFNFLPDPNYYGEQEFDYYIKDQSGVLNGPYKVRIIIAENPDIDGIPSKLEEIAPNGGDVNGDGIPDRKQNNITNVPLGSFADFQAGLDWANGVPGAVRPATSKVGSLLIGSLPGGKSGLDSLDLDPNAKFRNVALLPAPTIANSDRQFSSDLYQFTIEGLLTNAADTLSARLPLRDLDLTRPGLQVRAVLEFPVGMKGSTYLKKNAAGEWKSFKDDQNLATYDDGATLIDLDNDPATIERIVLTFTDGAFGDKDGLVNNSISDPGGLGIIKPVINDLVLLSRPEGAATGTQLHNVNDVNSQVDADEEGQALNYTLDPSNSAAIRAAVAIHPLTGVITVKDAEGFDYETFVDANGDARFSIIVRATDLDGNFDLATYSQTITNVDEYPRIISGKTVSYIEKQPTSVAVIKVQTLPDYQDLTSFSILPGLDGSAFSIDPVTGILLFVKSPNYDEKAVYTLDIQSKDLSGKTDHAVFTITIVDIDADNDGILDVLEIGPDPLNPIDTDGDGVPDYLDSDSDNDGVQDGTEVRDQTDSKNPCSLVVENQTEQLGIQNWDRLDCDGDGVSNANEIKLVVKNRAYGTVFRPMDSDGDGILDYLDTDDDGDGILTIKELPDLDGDGIPDDAVDTDGDGIADYLDMDDDGDGVLTKAELPDRDKDGIPDDAVDSDGDGKADYLDIDDDGDGVLTKAELPDRDKDGVPDDAVDTDGDGVADYLDMDDDGDGVSTKAELSDLDKDGVPDDAVDSDGDGVADYLDTDDDGDGILTKVELPDLDKDGIPDDAVDSDGDGVADYLDMDDDGDGVPTKVELPDLDGDGRPDDALDTDGDGKADYLDTDDDGNGIPTTNEVLDQDADGIPDFRDLDNDGDLVPDIVEIQDGTSPTNPEDYNDEDGDDVPDYVENLQGTDVSDPSDFLDSDGDGVPEYIEMVQQTNDSAASEFKDSDKDGVPDYTQIRSVQQSVLEEVVLVWGEKNYLSQFPTEVEVVIFSGKKTTFKVVWTKVESVNIFNRGTYKLTGTLEIPKGYYNPYKVNGILRVIVLPKPAPRDVTIDKDTFAGSTTTFFIPVGAFVINDPVDNIHVVSLLGDGYDNTYFYIKDKILYWNSAERAPGRTKFTIFIRVTDRDGNTLDKFFDITRTRPNVNDLMIYNTFTPNGDRFNDTWGVPGIRFYEGARILVYEKGGNRVFFTENPDVRWDGTFDGKEMPIGSYYWVIQVEETGEIRKGIVNLLRK